MEFSFGGGIFFVVVSLQRPNKVASLIVGVLYLEKKSSSAPCCWPERGNFQCYMQTVLQIAVGCCGGHAPFLQLLAFPLHFIPSIFPLINNEPQTHAGSGYMTVHRPSIKSRLGCFHPLSVDVNSISLAGIL